MKIDSKIINKMSDIVLGIWIVACITTLPSSVWCNFLGGFVVGAFTAFLIIIPIQDIAVIYINKKKLNNKSDSI